MSPSKIAWVAALWPLLSCATGQSPIAAADPEQRLAQILAGGEPHDPVELRAMQTHVQDLVARVLPAVVSFGNASGVSIEGGFVLTAGHVLDDAGKDFWMTLHDGRRIRGVSLGVNHRTDTGIVRITTEGSFPTVPIADSGELRRGQWCMMLGHPSGSKEGRSAPVRLGRVLRGRELGFVTTDCPMQGGDSGGPLFDMDGRVIGINSRIANDLAQNLHVAIGCFHAEWDDLLASKVTLPAGRRNTANLGLRWERDAEGACIRLVVRDSIAEKAGLRVGDFVRKVGGADVGDRFDAARALRDRNGDRVTLEIERDGELLEIEIDYSQTPEDRE